MRRAIILLLALAAPISARAERIELRATLTPGGEVPPVTDSSGHGEAALELDTATGRLSWRVTYVGLTGAPFMAHLHGPASEGVNAPVVVPFAQVVPSPIEGSATLTQAQIGELLAGRWYVNVHTRAHEAGEIRGQVTR